MHLEIGSRPLDYEAPSVADYGHLTELTLAIARDGRLDGASFDVANHHTCAVGPCGPHES